MNSNTTSTNTSIEPPIGKPEYSLTVPVTWSPKIERSFIDWILRKPQPQVEKERTFTFTMSKVVNQTRIAKIAAGLPNELYGNTAEELVIDKVEQHSKDLVYIVAAGIQNNHLEPDPELMLFIERNFDGKELHEAFSLSILQLGLDYFVASYALIKGTSSILKPREDA